MSVSLARGLVAVAVLATASLVLAAPTPHVGSEARKLAGLAATIDKAADAVTELRLDDAEQLLAGISGPNAAQPAVLFQLSRLHYYRGEYADAVRVAEAAMTTGTERQQQRFSEMFELMKASASLAATYEQTASNDGRYLVLHQPGKDAVLAGYALDVVARADRELEAVFGVRMPGPIRIEIYPDAKTLAQVSTLTLEQIETTGTIALSKWNRLMITSPKALVRGYPWADTITHELIHMVISRVTAEGAPVWLQEGTAKLFERSWRGGVVGVLDLDPSSRALLMDARKNDGLLTFEQMHPSIALLPSEDDAALAFAQVATFMEHYVKHHGVGALRDAFTRIADGEDARDALAASAGVRFALLESEWRKALPAHDQGARPRRLKTRFRVGDGPSDESDDVEESGARRFLRLGDLLWDRRRFGAASAEYRKAHGEDPLDPIVAARWGRAALESGDAQGAVDALTSQAILYPTHGPTHAILGAAHAKLGNHELARKELFEAIWINPFDPGPHCTLATTGAGGQDAGREREVCNILKQR